MRTNISIRFKNIRKRVYQDNNGNLYIIHKGEKLRCKKIEHTTFATYEVENHGWSLKED